MTDFVNNLAPNMVVKKALVLDFDGTIRRSKSGATFLTDENDIELMPGIEHIIWIYQQMGYLICGLSNQAGVAWGFKLPINVETEMDATLRLFKKNPFHIVKYCFHDGKGKVYPYNYRSLGRKPDIGLLFEMETECFKEGYIIDWNNSLFCGDRPEDEECARRAGIPFRHIDNFLKEPHDFTI